MLRPIVFPCIDYCVLQEVRLGGAPLQVMDLTNCSHLREVQLSAPFARPQLDDADQDRAGAGTLVLDGCTSMPAQTRAMLQSLME